MDLNHRWLTPHHWRGASERTLATAGNHFSRLHASTCRPPAEFRRRRSLTLTIYSQHPNRGKVQILATYIDEAGLRSSTVTSVDSDALAAPIVDALNRISACATLPVTVWDTRGSRSDRYPQDHLDALSDQDRRGDLLLGTHSLWYEYVKHLLHKALSDLDQALVSAPAPVRSNRLSRTSGCCLKQAL